MDESLPPNFEEGMEKSWKKLEYIALAEGLSNKSEKFPFPGIDPEAYAKLKAEEEQFPGMVTPIDELLKRFQNEGFKVVFGNDRMSGNIFIVPANSNDIEQDSLFPRHLSVSEDMDEELKALIIANQK